MNGIRKFEIDLAEQIADGGGRTTVRQLADCGHAPYLEKKEMIVPMVADFVRALA